MNRFPSIFASGALLSVALLSAVSPAAASPDSLKPFTGRWDLTLTAGDDVYPSWMEVTPGDSVPVVRLVGRVASVHPGNSVAFDGSQLSFTTNEWFGKTLKVEWKFSAAGGHLSGTQIRANGVEAKISGARAPALVRQVKAWGKPEPLFNGKDLAGWEPMTTGEPGKSAENHYKAIDGELVNEAPGANIRTTRKFTDFKLHIEYNCPKDGNSGVYLRGRYETQVEYEAAAANDKLHSMGSIYGFLAPSVDLPAKPGEWETFDITLVGRRVTVVRNGKTTIDNQEIPGITGGAVDSHEGEPGPLYIQGDHTGGMKYRNITVATPKV